MNTKESITYRIGRAGATGMHELLGQMEEFDPKFEESGEHCLMLCMVDVITSMLTELAVIIKEETKNE